jgi:hypothetical protein
LHLKLFKLKLAECSGCVGFAIRCRETGFINIFVVKASKNGEVKVVIAIGIVHRSALDQTHHVWQCIDIIHGKVFTGFVSSHHFISYS